MISSELPTSSRPAPIWVRVKSGCECDKNALLIKSCRLEQRYAYASSMRQEPAAPFSDLAPHSGSAPQGVQQVVRPQPSAAAPVIMRRGCKPLSM